MRIVALAYVATPLPYPLLVLWALLCWLSWSLGCDRLQSSSGWALHPGVQFIPECWSLSLAGWPMEIKVNLRLLPTNSSGASDCKLITLGPTSECLRGSPCQRRVRTDP